MTDLSHTLIRRLDEPAPTLAAIGAVLANLVQSLQRKPPLQTEDLGKMFEMAICLAGNTAYNGKYKYDMELPKQLAPRLSKLTSLFSSSYGHTAKHGSRHDFTCLTDASKHLSAKTVKAGGGKVAPQVIGQAQPKRFCELVGTEFVSVPHLKQYIQDPANISRILPILEGYTFDCPIVFYNRAKDTIRYIVQTSPIEWGKYEFRWTCDVAKWNVSSTLCIPREGKRGISLLEVEFHGKSRTNMAIRWSFENVLRLFREHFHIQDL